MSDDKRAYLYRHINGTVQRKPWIVVHMGGGPFEYFNGPNVRHWWREGDPEPGYDLTQAEGLVVE